LKKDKKEEASSSSSLDDKREKKGGIPFEVDGNLNIKKSAVNTKTIR
jgi:hypothetical protein